MKLRLIIDKSIPYLDYERDIAVEEWDSSLPVRKIDNLSIAANKPLFNQVPIYTIRLRDKGELGPVVDYLNRYSEEELSRRFTEGLIITCDLDRRSTKKLEKAVTEKGGEIVLADSKDRVKVTREIIGEFPIPKEVSDFIVDYLSVDYNLAIPLANQFKLMTEDELKSITFDDVMDQLPVAPGSVPPWDVEGAIFEEDLKSSCELVRRVGERGRPNYILTLGFLKKKVMRLYEVSMLLSRKPSMSKDDIADALGVKPNYGLIVDMKRAKSLGTEGASELLSIISRYDLLFKGGSLIRPDILMDTMIAEMCITVKDS